MLSDLIPGRRLKDFQICLWTLQFNFYPYSSSRSVQPGSTDSCSREISVSASCTNSLAHTSIS